VRRLRIVARDYKENKKLEKRISTYTKGQQQKVSVFCVVHGAKKLMEKRLKDKSTKFKYM
jgi:hypothetical protein